MPHRNPFLKKNNLHMASYLIMHGTVISVRIYWTVLKDFNKTKLSINNDRQLNYTTNFLLKFKGKKIKENPNKEEQGIISINL